MLAISQWKAKYCDKYGEIRSGSLLNLGYDCLPIEKSLKGLHPILRWIAIMLCTGLHFSLFNLSVQLKIISKHSIKLLKVFLC